MPKNRWIYVGILIVAAAALIYVTKFVLGKMDVMALYVAGGLGALLIVVGLVIEAKAKPSDLENKTDV